MSFPLRKEGAAFIESCLVMIMLCLILFGVLQLSYLIAARNVLGYTALATVRSGAIGLNDVMLQKVAMYTSIPTAGPMNRPILGGSSPQSKDWDYVIQRKNTPVSSLGWYEISVKQDFHLADNYRAVLDYDNWMNADSRVKIVYDFKASNDPDTLGMGEALVKQDVPLAFPFSDFFGKGLNQVVVYRSFAGENSAPKVELLPAVSIEIPSALMEDHASLYLKD